MYFIIVPTTERSILCTEIRVKQIVCSMLVLCCPMYISFLYFV